MHATKGFVINSISATGFQYYYSLGELEIIIFLNNVVFVISHRINNLKKFTQL